MPDGNQLPLTHWENILGRAKGCDIVVDFPTVSRTHAVLTRYDDGSWSVTDIGSRGAVTLNGEPVQMAAVNYGDTISLGRRGHGACTRHAVRARGAACQPHAPGPISTPLR